MTRRTMIEVVLKGREFLCKDFPVDILILDQKRLDAVELGSEDVVFKVHRQHNIPSKYLEYLTWCLPTIVTLATGAPKWVELKDKGTTIKLAPSLSEEIKTYEFTVIRTGAVGAEGYFNRTTFKVTLIPKKKEEIAGWTPPPVVEKKY